jgi:heme exporter protein D
MKEFFAMGGYGFYVWTSYAICTVVMVAVVVVARQRHREQIARIARRIKREQAGSQ